MRGNPSTGRYSTSDYMPESPGPIVREEIVTELRHTRNRAPRRTAEAGRAGLATRPRRVGGRTATKVPGSWHAARVSSRGLPYIKTDIR